MPPRLNSVYQNLLEFLCWKNYEQWYRFYVRSWDFRVFRFEIFRDKNPKIPGFSSRKIRFLQKFPSRPDQVYLLLNPTFKYYFQCFEISEKNIFVFLGNTLKDSHSKLEIGNKSQTKFKALNLKQNFIKYRIKCYIKYISNKRTWPF